MLRSPTLRQIEAFKAVIERGTVSGAAAVLNLSQPAVSKMLANLELDIDIELFERVRGRLVPTERAMRLYQEVDRIFGGLRQVEQAITDIRREEDGQINLGVIPGLSGPFLARVVTGFALRRPNVQVKIHSRESHQLLDWLRAGQLDIAVVNAAADAPGVRFADFMRADLRCMVPLDHPLAFHTEVGIEDIAPYDIIAFQPNSASRGQMDGLFSRAGLRPKIRFEATTAHDVISLVGAGLGIALAHPAFRAIAAESVRAVALRPVVPLSFQLCTQASGRRKKLVEDFASEIGTVAEEIALI